MKLLAIDTSTEACSAALMLDGELRERHAIAAREHGRLILPMVEGLLAEAGLRLAQLDALAYGRGPGGFTGVRIAAAVIQGFAFGGGLPVVPVSSLAALAQGAYRERSIAHVLAAVDARMGEVYWGVYAADAEGLMAPRGDETVCAPGAVPVPAEGPWFGAGSAWGVHAQALRARLGDRVTGYEAARYPRAQDVARLGVAGYHRGHAVSPEQALPVYLRDEVAWKKA
ncbi:MAG: tRNA (adenosine(37)-N6)-threonylcarbamoyltransferase complex dimerization subunit type 1 TsaB [Gammaproteobacteria bacterium]|nr:tRNA (adenosine(37)-N6)-threonylcarbamoyltransferase complex dimerization subunit type 1 TsaB [Gammaproteobacteria bacterium]